MKNKIKKFSHLLKSERNEIAILLNKKYSLRNIAKTLKRSVSTISDEIKLNSVEGTYDPIKADHKAYVKRKYAKYQGMKIVKNQKLKEFIEEKLYDNQSPRAIAGRLKKNRKTSA
jgi:IS30 family transposase